MKKKEKQIINGLMIGAFIFTLFLLFGFIQTFYSGTHNVDLGQNLRWLESTGINLVDIGSDGIKRTGTELYMLGLNQVKISYNLSIILSFFLGLFLMWIILKD